MEGQIITGQRPTRNLMFRVAVLVAAGQLTLTGSDVVAQVTPPAVLNPSDPALRFWVKSDTLIAAGLVEGSPVTTWIDQSQYGTIMAPRTMSDPNGPLSGFPVEENPHLRYVTINGKSVPSVRFDVNGDAFTTGDPNIDGSGARDRLYQMNNLAPQFDPLDIHDGSSLTTFVVFKPDFTTTTGSANAGHGWNAVFGKRGTNASAYQFSIKNFSNFGNFVFVQYDSVEQYHSLAVPRPAENVWHVSSMTVVDHPGAMGVDVLDILDDGSQNTTTKMVSLGVGLANGTPQNLIQNRNPSVPEPFGIGAFSQACCGELEKFSGNVAEIIIFARTLSPVEFADVENYLDVKYFGAAAAVDGDYDGDGDVDGADLVVWRGQFGDTAQGKPNADGDNDRDIDGADFLIWQRRLAGSSIVMESRSIPELASFTLAFGFFLGTATLHRSRRRVRVGWSGRDQGSITF